ncbi:FtsX-like permease family protein [Aneurinibacillus thermoaerophilus]|uniref:ABC transporter permease n=1 Tax=Aneurinibacillus thermoaerophilus TaxID=143495 RepID=A0ABX8YF64_ANETH|nr:ABC transporter permease [Aneurinibacillus thermoaerophilus]MED0674328.1 ABC transporter permease [Aneurinibacillus thermoaerophilus]MED0678347.1 ABC transporter permease [Aneurinibacillus thermoaerophilus]MED0736127.1 ABC transporter permease [Aneurinibacillus thermoaerophilus]MED0765625.1 ABC transporter permease [Aneurinibacillus thermoaerophilus]QYY44201.1 ABC transporter permease [Aneurinibacillus thermoaerophilus]
MKFRHLATSNIRGNWRQYTAFFFSSVFSVMIFFLYAQFILHPDVVGGKLQAANYVKQGMVACEYIIVIFSFFFVLYSLSAFLKSRSKEFGLLSLFGMTNGQIRRMVLTETMVIAALATTVGIGLGLLFSKLFLLALREIFKGAR